MLDWWLHIVYINNYIYYPNPLYSSYLNGQGETQQFMYKIIFSYTVFTNGTSYSPKYLDNGHSTVLTSNLHQLSHSEVT